MNIKVNKLILNKFKNKLKENKAARSDVTFNNAANFYGNFGSVKSFNYFDDDLEELPLKPNSHMALQLSTESPPVDDPDFVPASKEELGLAAARISKEVPNNKIEYFYRKLHKLLDAALDEDDEKLYSLQEAIDYELIPDSSHKIAIKRLIDQAVAMASRSTKDANYATKQDAALFAFSDNTISKYPEITYEDIIDEIEQVLEKPSAEVKLADALTGQATGTTAVTKDIIIDPPGDLTDLSPPIKKSAERKGKRKIVKGVKGRTIDEPGPAKKTKRQKPRRRKKTIEEPSTEGMDQRAEDELMDMLASAYTEFTEMEEYAATWDWTDYKEKAPYLKVIFDIIKGTLEKM